MINWIAKQAWSDGRVGMYGEGWSAYAPWAAAKKLPPALKAIATSAASVPGVNVPMEGNIFQNSAYAWSLQMTNGDAAEQSADKDGVWRALNEKWYRSGRPYRDLGRLYGKHNPVFIRWLNHPSYDGYWQNFVPYAKQFAQLDIPVLSITGYYAASEPGDLYYFTQHHRYNAHADHTLLIGPYDEESMGRGAWANLHGIQLDPAALIDFRELRYQWFDHVLKKCGDARAIDGSRQLPGDGRQRVAARRLRRSHGGWRAEVLPGCCWERHESPPEPAQAQR